MFNDQRVLKKKKTSKSLLCWRVNSQGLTKTSRRVATHRFFADCHPIGNFWKIIMDIGKPLWIKHPPKAIGNRQSNWRDPPKRRCKRNLDLSLTKSAAKLQLVQLNIFKKLELSLAKKRCSSTRKNKIMCPTVQQQCDSSRKNPHCLPSGNLT